MNKKMVVVCDAGKVLFYHYQNHHLEAISKLNDYNDHLSTEQSTSDRSGSQMGSGSNHHALDPQHDKHDQNKEKFAAEIVKIIEHAENDHIFDALIIAASPKMLGHLRHKMKSHTQSKIICEIDKDLTKSSNADLLAHLQAHC